VGLKDWQKYVSEQCISHISLHFQFLVLLSHGIVQGICKKIKQLVQCTFVVYKLWIKLMLSTCTCLRYPFQIQLRTYVMHLFLNQTSTSSLSCDITEMILNVRYEYVKSIKKYQQMDFSFLNIIFII
jgi:hypothetical protein